MASSPDYEERIREFEKRYALNPGSLVFAQLADLYRKSGEPDRALEILEEGLDEHPDYLSAHIVRGRSYRDMGDDAAAVEAFSRVLELDGENLVALRSLGEMARERGDSAEAKRWYERLLQVDPLNEEVQEVVDEMASTGGPEAPADTGERTGPPAGEDPQTGDRAGARAPGEEDPSLQAGATFDLDGETASPEVHEDSEAISGEAELREAFGEPDPTDESESEASGEPFRPAPEASESGPAAGGIGEDPEPETADGSAETGETSSAGTADEAVNRAFDAVESWRRETAEAEELVPEEERLQEEEPAREEQEPAPEEEPAPGEEAVAGEGAANEDEEALAAAWEEAYPEEPSTPAESDDLAVAPEASEKEEKRVTPAEAEDPVVGAEADEVEEEPAAGTPVARDREQSDDEVFTETLAGLYARQGFYTEAVEIYEELLRRRPGDETLRERMEAARESRDRTGERLTSDVPPEVADEASSLEKDEPSPPSGDPAEETPEETGSIGEHLRALLRGEAPVGFSAGALGELDA